MKKTSKPAAAGNSSRRKRRRKSGKSRAPRLEVEPVAGATEAPPAPDAGMQPPPEPPAPAASAHSCLDPAALDELRMLGGPDDPDFLAAVIAEFIEDASRRLDDLHTALRTGDAAALERAAHTLKGSSAHFGAASLAQISEDLQEKGKNGVLEGAVELVVETEKEFQRVRRALESYR